MFKGVNNYAPYNQQNTNPLHFINIFFKNKSSYGS